MVLMMLCILSFSKFHNLPDPGTNILIVFPLMRPQATGAVLDAVLCVPEIPAALISQGIQRTEAEQTAKVLWVCSFVAGEIFAFPMLKKIVVCHVIPSRKLDPVPLFHNTVYQNFVFQYTAVILNAFG